MISFILRGAKFLQYPCFTVRQWRLREAKALAQGHTAGKCQDLTCSPIGQDSPTPPHRNVLGHTVPFLRPSCSRISASSSTPGPCVDTSDRRELFLASCSSWSSTAYHCLLFTTLCSSWHSCFCSLTGWHIFPKAVLSAFCFSWSDGYMFPYSPCSTKRGHWCYFKFEPLPMKASFPDGSSGKESAWNVADLGSIPGLGRSPGEGNSYPLQYSGLENSMGCIVHGVTKRHYWATFIYLWREECILLNWRFVAQWHPTPVLLPGKSHGRRSLEGCSPWGCWGSDTSEWLHFHFSLSCIGEGSGNPLQCSCLKNPRDGGAWWAAVYGVTQSRTRLKWLSSRSSSTIGGFYLFNKSFTSKTKKESSVAISLKWFITNEKNDLGSYSQIYK